MAITFKYKKNAFLIGDPNNELTTTLGLFDASEGMPIANLMYFDDFGDEDAFNKAIAFDHELIHYVQDLMINACITDGYLTDYIKSYLSLSSNIEGVEFPLPFDDDAKYNMIIQGLKTDEDKDVLETLKVIYDIYKTVFLKTYQEENYEKYGSDVSDFEKSTYKLSFKDLVESHAYHKAFWDFYCRNQSQSEGCEMLHNIAINNNLYPYTYDNGRFETRDYRTSVYYRKMYMLPYYLILKAFPVEEIKKKYVDYCNYHIPYRYSESAGNWVHALFLLIIETALNIPGIDYIIKQVKDGKDINQFSPAYRFYKILDTINKDPQFLFETKEGEDYCKTFFNYVANDNGWIDYDETAKKMAYSLDNRVKMGHEVIVHYQMNIFAEKINNPKLYMHQLPAQMIMHFVLPLLIQQDNGIKIEFHIGNFIQDSSITTDFYTEYFRSDIKRYKTLEGTKEENELFSKILHNYHGAIREIVNRLFAADAREAHTRNKEYHCPLAQGGCHNKCDKCKSFKSFKSVFDNCSNKILRIGNLKQYVEDGQGNTPDCLYYNYLLDNKFNINQINFK